MTPDELADYRRRMVLRTARRRWVNQQAGMTAHPGRGVPRRVRQPVERTAGAIHKGSDHGYRGEGPDAS